MCRSVDPHMDITVRTDLDGGLSTATADGDRAGRLGFRIDRDHDGSEVWTIYTTVVDPRFEGRGVGSALVRDIIGHAERAGALVDPTCWFVAGWLDRHPEYRHMLIDDLR